MGRVTPPQLLILSFVCVIAVGTVFLTLPAATYGPGSLSLVDALFTSTSATCVTGLIVKDTGTCFTPFGRWVIFALFQAGGLGIMTFSTLFAVLLGRKIGLRERDVIQSTLDRNSIIGLKKLIFYILGITLTVEIAAAGLLFLRWNAVTEWTVMENLQNSVFHAVSGFCNAGFSLFSDSLSAFASDPWINIIMMGIIFLGGIGFVVILELPRLFTKKGHERRLSLQAKTALTVSGVLVIAGAGLLLFFERNNVFAGMSSGQRVIGAFFQSVTARTAGFNTVPIAELSLPSLVFLIFLMFVGASPGSTGGGIKTCTFAVIMATVSSMVKNNKRVSLGGRSVPRQVIREALVIFFLSAIWIFAATIVFSYFSRGAVRGGNAFIQILFEMFSAFGTVGLSTGITERLNDPGKICLIATMFAGRLGPLTLALAVAFRKGADKYVFPEENMMVG